MNKSMLMGVVAGIGVATAGGVAGYTFLGKPATVDEVAVEAAQPATTVAQAAPRATQTAAAAEECWDEEVAVTAEPKDQHAIAGTAVGAVVGGAIAKDVGDDKDLVTAAGAAAGAMIGRRLQQRMQDNRAEQRTATTLERRCAPVGTR
jgi:uncharacterized protein YcfJ